MTIHLIADGKIYSFSEKIPAVITYNVSVTAGEGGTVEGSGTYEEGATATVTASPAEHYDFVNWTEGGEVVSTTAEYSFTVTEDVELIANFQEHDKFTITTHAADNTMGYVTGGGTDVYVGTELVLKATAKTGYYFTQWQDGNTDNPRTITVDGDKEYIAEFAEAHPRVYAYDLNVVDNGDDTYTFTFKPNTDAVSGNLLLYSEDGASVVQTHAIGTPIAAHTATTITLNKTDLPYQSEVPWAIELSGNAIPTFAEAFADSDLRYARAHAVVDNSPESEYFGRIYVADRRKTKENSSVYIYNPDFTDFTSTKLGLSTAGYSRPAVGADGTLYLTGYTDGAEAGIFVVDPADLTKCTQFFNGTYDSDGLYKNNGKEIGSSTSGVGVYGAGKDAVLYTMMEDGSNANFNSGKQPIVCYQIGQDNGTVLKQWSDEPTWLVNYPATGKDSYNFGNNDFAATAKGVWVSQNKSNVDDRPEIAFVDKTGTIQLMQNSNKCLGGGMTVNADNTFLYIVEDSKILEYAIAWNENTPSLTLSNTYPISLAYVSTLSMDYAGNLIACAGTTYATTDDNKMKVVCFTLPTDNNHSIVPAAKTKAIKLGARYTVTVVVNDESMGEVIGAGSYKEGETVELAAAPVANHRIVDWKKGEEVLSTSLTCSFEVTEDVTINVTFEKIPQYTVTTIASPAGKGSITGGGLYNEGTNVTLTATAHTGYTFVRWEDDDTAEATRTITVAGNITYTAIFDKVSPRAWAYDLRKVENGENYEFTFTATSSGTATILFTDAEGNAVAPTKEVVGVVTAGETKTVPIAKTQFTGAQDIYWSVKVEGEAITKMAEITDPTKGIYNFYVPQGIAVDNSPNSMYFGRIYVASATTGGNDGGSEMAKDATAGLFMYNQELEKLNTNYEGIRPLNVAFNTNKPTSNDEINTIRQQMHRIAVNPITNEVAFAYYKSDATPSTAVYAMNPENLSGDAQNLIDGSSLTHANSLCYDENGVLYVMDNANTGVTGGQIYKVQNGEVELFAAHNKDCQWAVYDNAIVSDGRGGIWITQNRYGYDYALLSHVNSNGVVDFSVKENLNDWFPNNNTGSSYRGQCAYNSKENILAFAGNKMVTLFTVEYDGSGKPTINKLMSTPQLGGNIDGIAFDYAGDLYVASASSERLYKFVVPTNDNTCTVPAPMSQFIQKEARYTVTVVANEAAMGTVSAGGEYKAGEIITLTATANADYRFVNWTNGTEVISTDANFTYTVPAENVTIVANFAPLPEIAYELNGGVWNQYGWTSKKDMYNALLDDWRAYSGSTRTNVAYETQLGIGNSSKGIPTTVSSTDDRVALWNLFTDATYVSKWGWLATYVDAVAATQYKKMDVAQGVKTQPTSAAGVFTFTIGNFFGEDNAHAADYIDAVDFTGEEAHLTAFAPCWGQTFPMPTQPTEEVILHAPYKEGYLFDGWYATSNFSGSEVTAVDPNTDGTLYAKWIEHKYTRDVTNGHYGTICLPYGSSDYTGAEFYEIAYLEMDGENPKTLWLDEVDGVLEAGKPYIFKATSDMLVVLYEGEEVLSPISGNAGLTGTFKKIEDGNAGDANNKLEGNYLIVQQQFWLCLGNCSLAENRAYIDHDDLHANTKPISPIPGRRRVGMGSAQENTTTGVSNITEGSTIDPVKRGIYDVMGRKLDQPTTTGFYIIDGKKVFIVK